MKSKEPRWLGADLTQLARVGSTNQVLRERMRREHVPEGAVVLAREQTAGRGRLGRRLTTIAHDWLEYVVRNP
ncbi:hypothetical protein [Sulfobacillus thermotolerans]|uniref:hypothetical protein n=1 Tax=Sulfobacillus thermotolerans TaxID=338644 RepID=UPI003366B6BD